MQVNGPPTTQVRLRLHLFLDVYELILITEAGGMTVGKNVHFLDSTRSSCSRSTFSAAPHLLRSAHHRAKEPAVEQYGNAQTAADEWSYRCSQRLACLHLRSSRAPTFWIAGILPVSLCFVLELVGHMHDGHP